MPKLDYRNIEKDAARCGGQPVVVGTRIRVATILTCYRQGMSLEEIVQQYPSLQLADVYSVIGYYLHRQAEVDAYLRDRQRQTTEVRQENAARSDPVGVRDRLLARRAQQG